MSQHAAISEDPHVIGVVRGERRGPTLVVMGGIHGNEPAGVKAAQRILPQLQKNSAAVCGEVVFLRGNTRALRQNLRYLDSDLNRQWNTYMQSPNALPAESSEQLERHEILQTLEPVIDSARGELYFIDLHTTSARGEPFATVGDTLRNRRFALQFPITIVLGLEEQIEGTLLEYLNNLGAVTLGFEGGQHESESAVDHHEAVIWSAIVAAGNLDSAQLPEFDKYQALLKRACGGSKVIEVRYRHAIRPEDGFKMEPGFENFQPVSKGQLLAKDRNGAIVAQETGLILMPLYQPLGDDGFFLTREVKRFWLRLSALLRELEVGNHVRFLPGVRRDLDNPNVLNINTRVARFVPLQIFHLLGFRKLRWRDESLIVSRRAYDLEGPTQIKLSKTPGIS